MMGEKKDFKVQTFEDLISVCVPPEKVREEIKRNFLMANISILRIFKTLLDYNIEVLEKLAGTEETSKNKEAPKKIELD
jgi:hypothetical protein